MNLSFFLAKFNKLKILNAAEDQSSDHWKSKYMNKLRTSKILRTLLKQIKWLNQISAFHFLALHVFWIYVFFLVKVNKSKKIETPQAAKVKIIFIQWMKFNKFNRCKKSQKNKHFCLQFLFCIEFIFLSGQIQ